MGASFKSGACCRNALACAQPCPKSGPRWENRRRRCAVEQIFTTETEARSAKRRLVRREFFCDSRLPVVSSLRLPRLVRQPTTSEIYSLSASASVNTLPRQRAAWSFLNFHHSEDFHSPGDPCTGFSVRFAAGNIAKMITQSPAHRKSQPDSDAESASHGRAVPLTGQPNCGGEGCHVIQKRYSDWMVSCRRRGGSIQKPR